jgi:hypothetical protein
MCGRSSYSGFGEEQRDVKGDISVLAQSAPFVVEDPLVDETKVKFSSNMVKLDLLIEGLKAFEELDRRGDERRRGTLGLR